ncbi:hypothetical protein WDW89_17655 [Deltaproteobacteria bacterium TL4]
MTLYALVHHEPVQRLKSFRGTESLEEIRKNEIYELKLSTMSPVRFIITQQSQHPLLTLFSNDREKVLTQFPEFYQERGLFEEISRYLYRLTEYYGIVESNMYTKADFLRDNPDVQSVSALLFPKIYYEALEKGICSPFPHPLSQTARNRFARPVRTPKCVLLPG